MPSRFRSTKTARYSGGNCPRTVSSCWDRLDPVAGIGGRGRRRRLHGLLGGFGVERHRLVALPELELVHEVGRNPVKISLGLAHELLAGPCEAVEGRFPAPGPARGAGCATGASGIGAGPRGTARRQTPRTPSAGASAGTRPLRLRSCVLLSVKTRRKGRSGYLYESSVPRLSAHASLCEQGSQ